MKISELLEQLDSFDDESRDKYVRPLMKMFSPVSIQTIKEHQKSHFDKYPDSERWDEFLAGLNKVLQECIMLETSEVIGTPVRKECGLEPITLNTEIICE